MLSFFTLLVAAASLAVALPGTPSQTGEASSSIQSPLSPSAAAEIFQNGNITNVPQVVPHIVSFQPTPRPSPHLSPEVPVLPKPSLVGIKPPSNPVESTPPGIPRSGNISVIPPAHIPINSVLGLDHNHVTRDILGSRQACPYPYCCPDPRYLNENTAFPYNVIGKIISPGLSCTGVLVGPNLVLTASHCIEWINCRESFGTVEFIPDYWPGNEPDGVFYGWKVAYYDDGACGDPTTFLQQALDFVVITLTEDTGLPWMGTRTYNTAWNGGDYWYEQGYAASAGGTNYPYVQVGFPVVQEVAEGEGSYLLEYAACGTPGDSGSPVWGWWSDGPYLIGLMTYSEEGAVWGPGGALIANLISQQN